MLSVSTISSESSSAFSAASNQDALTPSSQYSIELIKQASILNELIETEQSYIESLKLIDSQVSSVWMKQTTSVIPEFSELLKHTHDVLKTNKQFYIKLIKMVHSLQAVQEFNDVLIQWINDLEIPYTNYCRSYIPNINQRRDILSDTFISSLIQRLLEGIDSSTPDYKLFMNANKKIGMILTKSQKVNRYTNVTHKNNQSGFEFDLKVFENQVNCSETMDLFRGTHVDYKQFRISNPGSQMVMRDSFVMLSNEQNGLPTRVHLVLTTEVLVVCRELDNHSYSLMYPPIPICDITVKAKAFEREILGEYLIQISVIGRKHFIIRADSKEMRNTWVGVDQDSPKNIQLRSRPLQLVAQKKMLSPQLPSDAHSDDSYAAKHQDFLGYYYKNSGASPLEISDKAKDEVIEGKPRANTKLENAKTYEYRHEIPEDKKELDLLIEGLANTLSQSVKTLPQVPNVAQIQKASTMDQPNKVNLNVNSASPIKQNVNHPVKDASHVQMTYIQESIDQMGTMSISNSIAEDSSFPSSSSLKSNISTMNASEKPASPRAVEVQRAVVPEIMQAVTQNTEEYLETTMKKDRLLQSANAPAAARAALQKTIPRTSSMREHYQKPLPQQPSPQQIYSSCPTNANNGPQAQSIAGMPTYSNRPMQASSVQQQQQSPRPQYNNQPMNGPLSPNQQSHKAYNNGPSSPQPQSMRSQYNNGGPSPGLQQPPEQCNVPSPSSSHVQMNNFSDEWNSPPHSPNASINNSIKQILYRNDQCQVFHWHNQSWYAADGQCLLQVRLTHSNRTCVAVELRNTGQLYLNAWILPNTVIRQPSPTDVSVSVYMGSKKENYLIHFPQPQEASILVNILQHAHQESIQPSPPALSPTMEQEDEVEPVDNVNCPQTLKPLMQCKAKLFVQTETSKWNTFGSVTTLISQQTPSMRMMIQIENEKTKLVSAVVRSGNVEKISSKRISFLLSDETQKTSIVYMIHLREEETGNKIYEYLRLKNSEYGW
ncbi:hypothetical protein G6F37_008190 [Rhizopus arrhizus]|nr:hypothetical protein G6F38_004021 [Rhizopus arrhizus]KAG1155813.1 hypothetical protein G6F37_008190 [Rhizopus arrhizus]